LTTTNTNPVMSTNTTYFIGGIHNSSDNSICVYRDGTHDGFKCVIQTLGTTPANTNLGRWSGGASNYWNGWIDEVRISASVAATRGDPWITTEFNTMNSPSTFYTVGSPVVLDTPRRKSRVFGFKIHPEKWQKAA